MNKKSFTMAEILLSLTIIGVVAAITLPALTGNINERTWNTQRKALYARMSQAIDMMPTLNGYGVDIASDNNTKKNAAHTFITNGLSKVITIKNICDKDNLKKCGLPDKIKTLKNTSINFPKKLSELNSGIVDAIVSLNTDVAGMETANGESVGVFYNPNCVSKDILPVKVHSSGITGYYVKQHVCANFLYDLNGSKGPNKLGKDIGYITAFYPTDSEIVMILPAKIVSDNLEFNQTSQKCRSFNNDYRVPNIKEAVSVYYNNLLNGDIMSSWTSISADDTHGWFVGESAGVIYPYKKTDKYAVMCIKR